MSVLILTLDLFVRQWRHRYEAVLGVESLMKPIKMFVSSGHLDVVELITEHGLDYDYEGERLTLGVS